MKFFDTFKPKKIHPKSNKVTSSSSTSLPSPLSQGKVLAVPIKTNGDAGGRKPELTKEERIFLNSDNPRFPKNDVTLSLIDRRGNVNAKDYDYVEFGDNSRTSSSSKTSAAAARNKIPMDTTFAGDISAGDDGEEDEDEEGFVSKLGFKLSQKEKKKRKTAARRDMELWEVESYPKSIRHYRQGGPSSFPVSVAAAGSTPKNEEENSGPFRSFQVPSTLGHSGANKNGVEERAFLNYTTDSGYFPGTLHKRIRKSRTRREIFNNHQPLEGAVQSLFQDIQNNYPKMLERLSDSVNLPELPDTSNIAHLLEGAGGDIDSVLPIRRIRSSSFIHEDSRENEIGYPKPVTFKSIDFDRNEEDEDRKSAVSSFVSAFIQRVRGIKKQLRSFFTS